MTDEDWDVTELTEAAWAGFEAKLMQYVDEAPPGAMLTFDVAVAEEPEEGSTPWVQVLKDTDRVLVQVVSNVHLAPTYAMTLAQEQQLFAWGFARPGTPVDFPMMDSGIPDVWSLLEEQPTNAEVVASAAISVLREVFGVIDPALMDISGSGDEGRSAALLPQPPEPDADDDVPAFRIASPDDQAQLRSYIGELLEERPWPVTVDDDGDHLVHHPSGPIWVRARSDEPTIEIFTRVVAGVRSRRQAAVELAILNRDQVKVKFQLYDRAVLETLALPAMPFVGEHLWTAIDEFLEVLVRVRDDLSLRTGGAR